MTESLNKGGTATPQEAASNFSKYLLAGDFDGALSVCAIREISNEEALGQVKSLASIYSKVGEIGNLKIEIGDAEINGDEAEIAATFIANGKEGPWDFMAVKIDGKWFVDMGF